MVDAGVASPPKTVEHPWNVAGVRRTCVVSDLPNHLSTNASLSCTATFFLLTSRPDRERSLASKAKAAESKVAHYCRTRASRSH